MIGAFLGLLVLGAAGEAIAQEPPQDAKDKKIERLERVVQQLSEEMRQLKEERKQEKPHQDKPEKSVAELAKEYVESQKSEHSVLLDPDSWLNRFTLGGYGEHHANFTEGGGPDQSDIHRLVLYLGYDFAEWIKFRSETEIEHAFVAPEEDSGGEVSVEQAYFDFLLAKYVNVRVGRLLTPLGIVNQRHEPPAFNGVERPAFDRFIIPTTWFSDGAGLFGRLTPSLTYQAYVVGSLDGSKFNAIDGIREGRIEQSPSLHQPAFTGRLDLYLFAERAARFNQALRFGLSTYIGGLNNANEGGKSGINGDIQIYSGDFEYSIWKLDFRGALAWEKINGARQIGNGTASQIFGWNMEAGYHLMPDAWKVGRFRKSDAVVFLRYDDYNTQFRMPSGVARDPAGVRNELTLGLNFYFLPNLVFKTDFQVPGDKTGQDLDKKINVGIGWQF